MSIEISMGQDIAKIPVFLTKVRTKALGKAVNRSLNRTVTGMRKQASDGLRKRVKLKVGEIKRRIFINRSKASQPISQMEASLVVSGRPIPLLKFVRGKKEPASQKGIPVRKRRKIRVQITPGKTRRLRSAFIADVHTKQVFRRKGKGRSRLAKQAIPGLGSLFGKAAMLEPVESFAVARYHREFEANFRFFLSRVK